MNPSDSVSQPSDSVTAGSLHKTPKCRQENLECSSPSSTEQNTPPVIAKSCALFSLHHTSQSRKVPERKTLQEQRAHVPTPAEAPLDSDTAPVQALFTTEHCEETKCALLMDWSKEIRDLHSAAIANVLRLYLMIWKKLITKYSSSIGQQSWIACRS